MGYTIVWETVADIDTINRKRLHDAAVALASAAYHSLGHAYTVIKDRGEYLQMWTKADNAESLEIGYHVGDSGFCKTFRRDFTLIVAGILGYAEANGWVSVDSDDNTEELYQLGLAIGAEMARREVVESHEQLWEEWDIMGQLKAMSNYLFLKAEQ
ncbi:hypothetical protein KC887_04405 [Candidatus Kaiserbacteria bacterium]|nr:hypothetical protein [Candidatus Kaiserbacteria bacterium]